MFGLFRRKQTAGSDDPLSDLRTVSRWLENLPAGDIYSAQEQVVQSLIQFNHSGLAMSRERLQVLLHLDQQARDMQYSLCMQYLRNPRMSKLIESRLWSAIHAFYWEITRGYHAFLMDFVANPGGSKIQQSIPLIAARAIRGFGDIFRWRYFRYERGEEKLWLRMHNIYRIAEFDRFQDSRIKLYEHDAKPSTCQEEYLRALLLSPMGSGSLTPRQLELVDRWLANWPHLFTLDKDYKPGVHNYLVDLSHGQGLRRIRANTSTEPNYRFVSTETLLRHLDTVTQALRGGATAASLGLGEDFRLPDGYDLIEYARNEWAPTSDRERRDSPRQSVDGRCEVLHGVTNICQRMQFDLDLAAGITPSHALTPEEILDIKLYGFVTERTKAALAQRNLVHGEQAIERWSMRDRSELGLGVSLKNDQSEWVRVGKLLALRLGPAAPWQIAVVRRISRVDEEWRRIGIRLLPHAPVLGRLETAHDRSTLTYNADGTAYGGEEPASPALVYAGTDPEPMLVLEAAKYAYGRQYRLCQAQDTPRLIQLDAVRDKGDGWLMCTYFNID